MEENLDEIPAGNLQALIPVPGKDDIPVVNQEADPFIIKRANKLDRVVGRCVINNQHLETRVGLSQRRFKTILNPTGPVESRNTDGNEGKGRAGKIPRGRSHLLIKFSRAASVVGTNGFV